MPNHFGGRGSTGGTVYVRCRCGHASQKHTYSYDLKRPAKCRVKGCLCVMYEAQPPVSPGRPAP